MVGDSAAGGEGERRGDGEAADRVAWRRCTGCAGTAIAGSDPCQGGSRALLFGGRPSGGVAAPGDGFAQAFEQAFEFRHAFAEIAHLIAKAVDCGL